MDVVGEVGADGCGWDGDARCPLGDEVVDVCEAGVAAGVEVGGELLGCEVDEGVGTNGPDGGDPGQSGTLAPEFGEVEPEERSVDCGFDLGAMFAGEQSGVADEERCVSVREHGERVSGLLDEVGVSVVEVFKEDASVGDGAERGGVSRDCADVCERGVSGEAARVLYQQKDAAHLSE